MRTSGLFARLGLLVVAVHLAVSLAHAKRLYNKRKDEAAQLTAQLALDLETGALFEKQLRNALALSEYDIETYLLAARRLTRAQILNFKTWNDVDVLVAKVKTAVEPITVNHQQRLEDVKREMRRVKSVLTALRTDRPDDDPGFAALFERAGDIEPVLQRFEKLVADGDEKKTAALKDAAVVLKQLGDLYTNYRARADEIKQLDTRLAQLKVPLQKILLAGLEVEEEHWKRVAAIHARRERELEDVRTLVKSYEIRIRRFRADYCRAEKTEAIEQTLRRSAAGDFCAPSSTTARARTADFSLALYEAAALAARGFAAQDLFELRLAQQQHLYSIRKSAVQARAYELTLSTGAQRLALYYAGGITPARITALVYGLWTSLAEPPFKP